MRILLSAYGCQPDMGSEQAVGWNIAQELARQGHEVTVISCGGHHRAPVEAWLAAHGTPLGLRFIWHDVPGFPAPGFVGNGPIRRHYMAWQRTAPGVLREAMAAGARFDVVHHLTWGSWRMPSHMGELGLPFVIGPVGGGMSPPRALREAFPARPQRWELKRDLANIAGCFYPPLWRSFAAADRILLSDRATRAFLPWPFRRKVRVLNHVACEPPAVPAPDAPARADDGLRLLWVGRIEEWKGLRFAVGAFARLLRQHPGARFTIIGQGPHEAACEALIDQHGIRHAIDRIPRAPYHSLAAIYRTHDLLMAPCTRDIGGLAIAEALSNGLPVLALDRDEDAGIVDQSCGLLIPVRGRSHTQIETAMAQAISLVAEEPGALKRLRAGALARARSRSWNALARSFVAIYQTALETSQGRQEVARQGWSRLNPGTIGRSMISMARSVTRPGS